MGSLSIWHWLIVLAIISLVFGTSKLRNLGSDLGSAVKGFKQGVKEVDSLEALKSQAACVEPGPGQAIRTRSVE